MATRPTNKFNQTIQKTNFMRCTNFLFLFRLRNFLLYVVLFSPIYQRLISQQQQQKNLIKTTLLAHKSKYILLCLYNFNFHLTLLVRYQLEFQQKYKIDNPNWNIAPAEQQKGDGIAARLSFINRMNNVSAVQCTRRCIMYISTWVYLLFSSLSLSRFVSGNFAACLCV